MALDEILRTGIVLFLLGGVAMIVLGGFARSVAGRWKDGDRTIYLRQWGPVVRGHCARSGGHEMYKGTAFFGRVILDRFDYGAEHLQNIGFSAEDGALLKDRSTARFELRLRKGALRGEFFGRTFSFADAPKRKIVSVRRLAPEPRIWERG